MPNLGDDKRPSDGDKPSTREKVTENLAEADSVETRNLPGSLIVVNASGHVQELDKNFNLASLIAVGITIGNVWPAAAGKDICFPSVIAWSMFGADKSCFLYCRECCMSDLTHLTLRYSSSSFRHER